MADVSSNENEVLRYVLGEFSAAERREFESRMAASVELRALVDELETGMVAVATASPRRRPPPEVWQRIEKAVVRETRPKLAFPAFGFGWLRSGWAVAVACLMGWVFYAFLLNRHEVPAAAKLKIPPGEIAVATSAEPPPKPVAAPSLVASATNAAVELLQARAREIMELRGKIARLETVTTQLSRSLAQQHALLGESNRIKFYHLSAVSTTSGKGSTAPLSPGLQRAVLTALARELGWLPAGSTSATQTGGNFPPIPVTFGGVDFIDLLPGSQTVFSQPQIQSQVGSGRQTADNTAAGTQVPPLVQPQIESTAPAASPGTTAPDPAIPAFVSGDNLVVAMDSTIVPAGSSVTLTVLDANQNATGGTFILGNNPAVLTIPLSDLSDPSASPYVVAGFSGWMVNINSIFPNGQTGTMQFFTPATNP